MLQLLFHLPAADPHIFEQMILKEEHKSKCSHTCFALLAFSCSEVSGTALKGKSHEIHQKEKVVTWERIAEQSNPT